MHEMDVNNESPLCRYINEIHRFLDILGRPRYIHTMHEMDVNNESPLGRYINGIHRSLDILGWFRCGMHDA